MPCPPSGLRQIDAAEKQGEFLVAQDDFAFFARGFRPAEPSLLQPLGAHPQAAAIPEQSFGRFAAHWRTERHVRSADRTPTGLAPDRRASPKLLRMSVVPAAR